MPEDTEPLGVSKDTEPLGVSKDTELLGVPEGAEPRVPKGTEPLGVPEGPELLPPPACRGRVGEGALPYAARLAGDSVKRE